jgi:hypothetical protein
LKFGTSAESPFNSLRFSIRQKIRMAGRKNQRPPSAAATEVRGAAREADINRAGLAEQQAAFRLR